MAFESDLECIVFILSVLSSAFLLYLAFVGTFAKPSDSIFSAICSVAADNGSMNAYYQFMLAAVVFIISYGLLNWKIVAYWVLVYSFIGYIQGWVFKVKNKRLQRKTA